MAVTAGAEAAENEGDSSFEEENEQSSEVELELRELHSRIGDTSSLYNPLREEAVGVLHKALQLSRSLHISHSTKPPPAPPPPSSDDDLHLLLHELQSLKSLLPPAYNQDDSCSTSCVISSALNYIEQLSRRIQGMKEGTQEFTNLSRDYFKNELSLVKDHSFCNVEHVGKVKLDSLHDAKLRILIQCKKRAGLLKNLILVFDTLGLVIDQMDISNDDYFQMDVIITQVAEKAIDSGMLKKTLSKVVCEGYQNISKI